MQVVKYFHVTLQKGYTRTNTEIQPSWFPKIEICNLPHPSSTSHGSKYFVFADEHSLLPNRAAVRSFMQNIKKTSQTIQSMYLHTTNLNNVHSLRSLCIIFWNLYCVRLHRTLFQCSLKLIQENFLWLIQESGSVPISTKAVLSATKVVFLVQQLIFYLLFSGVPHVYRGRSPLQLQLPEHYAVPAAHVDLRARVPGQL